MAEEQKNQAAEEKKSEKTGKGKPVKKKKKTRKNVPIAIVHIQSTFNNTIVSVTDMQGNIIAWSSGGVCGFKGARKGTPFAAQLAVEDALRKASAHGVKQVNIYVKGPGAGRDQALRVLQRTGVRVVGIRDVTPLPHNGCRPPKKRRV